MFDQSATEASLQKIGKCYFTEILVFLYLLLLLTPVSEHAISVCHINTSEILDLRVI